MKLLHSSSGQGRVLFPALLVDSPPPYRPPLHDKATQVINNLMFLLAQTNLYTLFTGFFKVSFIKTGGRVHMD